MKPGGVVVIDELSHDAFGILQAERSLVSNGALFQCAMITLEFAVALRVVRRTKDVTGLPKPNELLEVTRNELRPVVRDKARPGQRMSFARALNDKLSVGLFHLRANVPGHNGARASIQDRAEVVEGAAHVEVGKVHVPMLMGSKRLDKTFTLG